MEHLVCEAPARGTEAQRLADTLGLAMTSAPPAQGLYLACTEERLELRQAGPGAPGPVYVDFTGGRLGYRGSHVSPRREPLARAAGLKGGHRPQVMDATAGLGRDAFILATLGCRVLLLERHPVIAALLQDGLRRAALQLPEVTSRMTLQRVDALAGLAAHTAGVVCLDPMYPHRDKQALVKKEMRVFRALVGDDPDADHLLQAARAAARERVVVKRPVRAQPLAEQPPDFSVPGNSTRFDVYLGASPSTSRVSETSR
ncbi:class I SAM-dependent methyltransferase [Ectothiorhodospira mobilis]|uniref:class I SAM-dependent methyltransferase n=1 Tax=Ectothiorhodospira mobilis TaxID=195064 RepID=UPI0019056CAC|nr:class I SAM-dependent methyltransferase [Ectothiorhodospira mobilis]MBK1690937.1 rRNA methyltransferase [Ectothiorhodospira mobilis]